MARFEEFLELTDKERAAKIRRFYLGAPFPMNYLPYSDRPGLAFLIGLVLTQEA